VVFGFSWKIDLISLTSSFPFDLRETIGSLSKHISVNTFSSIETNALLNQLATEIRSALREDLKFFLSEFSQGYPWLLKKLCAHVKSQRMTGVSQENIAINLLNVEQLFQEDLARLSPGQIDTLKKIAKRAPILVSDLDEFSHEVIQSLVNSRLIVMIGNRCDIYWDIFRDYLNSEYVPIQEHYLLRSGVKRVVRFLQIISQAGGVIESETLLSQSAEKDLLTSKGTFYNLVRDLKLLGLAIVEDGQLTLKIDFPNDPNDFQNSLRAYLQTRLGRNRIVTRFIDHLTTENNLTIDSAAQILSELCPYISASTKTWRTYALTLMGWIDAAELGFYSEQEKMLISYLPSMEIPKRDLLLPKRRGGITVPNIQFKPIVEVAERLVQAASSNRVLDATGLTRSAIAKSLGTLEDLGFIVRKTRSIQLTQDLLTFVNDPHSRPEMFGNRALHNKTFREFVSILERHQVTGKTRQELGIELKEILQLDWTDETTLVNVNIMLNWARHADLAPGVFSKRRKRYPDLGRDTDQPTLFDFDVE
jgi:hypothetical protein